MSDKWTVERIPSQPGRVALVTGANSGLGLVITRELARAGARVVMACRNTERGQQAARQIEAALPSAALEVSELDLGNLDSVSRFAQRFRDQGAGLDLLVNNAGVMAPPRTETADGFELQFGTNHLGHFALTGQLIGELRGSDDARVVTMSSGAHRIGKITFDDLQRNRRYNRWTAYGQSKLANLMFALELDRRLRASGWSVTSVAAHPGYAATNLQSAAAPKLDRALMAVTNRLLAQSADMGALPALYAATAPGVRGGQFIGPDGIAEQRGHPEPVTPSADARDEDVAARLWEVSEQLTGVSFELAGAPA
jgi:NAD(P)-dependent dehydrogenase (short-subunit alcohol dehydrogenase family)